MSDHQTELAKIEEAIKALDNFRGVLSDKQIEISRSELQAKKATIQTQLINSGQTQQGDHTIAIQQGDQGQSIAHTQAKNILAADAISADVSGAVSGHVVIALEGANVYISEQPVEITAVEQESALGRYLHYVIETNRRLQLQGIRSAGQLVTIGLEQIYITLTATEQRTVALEETWLEESGRLAPGEEKRRERIAAPHSRETVAQVKVKIQEALAAHTRLVVLGDPGCGKTTLLRYLALTYGRDLAEQARLVKARLGLEESRLPIFLPLRDFAHYLEAEHPNPGLDGPKLLLNYLRRYCALHDISLPERFFADPLDRGECVVLLDGVDEVAGLETRYRIARIVERFTLTYANNRYVVTSRLVGYKDSARLGMEYASTRVRDFNRADIERFVRYWNLAVEVTLAGNDSQAVRFMAKQQSNRLLEAIERSDRVRDLAVNPLLLTVIALVQRYRAQLPERRTELYEEAIEVLLGQWDIGKGLPIKTMLAGQDLDAGDRRSMLEPIALWMMEQQQREIEGPALKQQLEEQFLDMTADLRQARRAVDEFLRLIKERSGLLSERGYNSYSFSHLTFQEHLAARAVAAKADYVAYTMKRLGESWWRETIMLEVGYLSTQGKQRATPLLQAIMDNPQEPEPYHNLILAAECLRDVGLVRVGAGLWQEIQQRLQKEFEQPLRGKRGTIATLIKRRAAAAEALGRIESGGPGTQPAFWRLPYGEPVWVEIPAGKFWMGSERISIAEKSLHKVYLLAYKIGRTPVSNAQYQLFVKDSGHQGPSHWEDGRPPKDLESHPVVRVSWHDALAYCRWLSEKTGKTISLPSEAQWEKAARGDKDKREYPWGNKFKATRCNNSELGLGQTTPVGIFPEGVSLYGCLDMSGNVWEWCVTKCDDGFKPYPYDAEEDEWTKDYLTSRLPRVVRGGSFILSGWRVRCAFRINNYPDYRSNNQGFRVVSE